MESLTAAMNVVGKNVRYYREMKNILQKELGYITGIDPSIINRIENQRNYNPEMLTIARIAYALEVDLILLFEPRAPIQLVN